MFPSDFPVPASRPQHANRMQKFSNGQSTASVGEGTAYGVLLSDLFGLVVC